jgi:DNA replication licensing factor MCM6
MQSDIEGFPDDEVVGRRGMRRATTGAPDVPRVVDTTAETLGTQFERFLEKLVVRRGEARGIADME